MIILLYQSSFSLRSFGKAKKNKNKITNIQLLTVDLLARVSMKNVAKCDK